VTHASNGQPAPVVPPGPAFASPLGTLRVLIVEGSAGSHAPTAQILRETGMVTECVAGAATAIMRRCAFRPDVVLLDQDVPEVADLSLVSHFGDDYCCGVIVLTSRLDEQTRVAGLEAGADDMVVKPPLRRELVARIRAVHRRLRRSDLSAACRSMAGLPQPLSVDHSQRCLSGHGEARVPLTEAELRALDCLLEGQGASVSRACLSQTALHRALHEDDRSVDQLVLKLRRKIAGLGGSERAIQSVRRQGYIIPEPGMFRTIAPSRAPERLDEAPDLHESVPAWGGE
jgi:two-component system, OmpR family, response regulator